MIRAAAVATLFVLFVAFLAACATREPPRPPEPITVTKEVDRIVQVRCEDKRPPAPDLPDDDEDLRAVEGGDIFGLAQIYRAARELYRQRLREDDAQIAACTGG